MLSFLDPFTDTRVVLMTIPQPPYPAYDYCANCGLTFTHLDGCHGNDRAEAPHAPRIRRGVDVELEKAG